MLPLFSCCARKLSCGSIGRSCGARKLSCCVKRRVEIMAGLVWKGQERGDIMDLYTGMI